MDKLFSMIQANGIGIILMAIILFSLVKNYNSRMFADKIFFALVISVMVVCFLEIMGTIFNGYTYKGAKILNRVFNSLLFASNPLPAFLWAVYANYKIYENEHKLKKIYKYLAIPLLIVACLSFANIFIDIFFTITPDNYYKRTDFFFISTLLSAFYAVYVATIVFVQRKNIGKKLYIPLLSFMILPVIGLILQFSFYGIYLLWVSVALSIIIIFNHVQNDTSITDWLTGLYNRKHLDKYIRQMCKRKRDDFLVGMMFDVDSFKAINDTYGHLSGDIALKNIALVIKNSFGSNAYLARYAGDEFVALLVVSNEDEIKNIIAKIKEDLVVFNQKSDCNFNLSVSVGYAIFKGYEVETEFDFLARIDEEMYKAKNLRANQISG